MGFFQAKYDYDLDVEVQREEAEKIGEQRGRLEEIFSSVQEGDYSLSRGAQKASLSTAEFKQAMKQAGYQIPSEP